MLILLNHKRLQKAKRDKSVYGERRTQVQKVEKKCTLQDDFEEHKEPKSTPRTLDPAVLARVAGRFKLFTFCQVYAIFECNRPKQILSGPNLFDPSATLVIGKL